MSLKLLRRLVPAAAGFALLAVVGSARSQTFQSSASGLTGGSMGSGSSMGTGSSGSGGSFLGSSGSSGSGSSGGSSFLGSGGVGTTSASRTTGSSTTTPGSSSFLGTSYAPVLGQGYSGLTSFAAASSNPQVIRTDQFGTPLFTITLPNTTGGNFSRATGTSGTSTVTVSQHGTPYSASSVGMTRTPSYVTEPRFRAPPITLTAMAQGAREAIAGADQLATRGGVSVQMDGPVVVLRGAVASADDRNLAEDLVRLTPGISAVRNEITVRP